MIFVVTGCEGFIGRNFTNLLLNKGHYVYGIDKLTYASKQISAIMNNALGGTELKIFKQYKLIKEDIKDVTYLPDCDYIVNFAAESHVDNSIGSSDEFLNSNILGVKNLLQLARTKYKKPIFIQISTDEVYGESASGSCDEESVLKPGNPYSASKASADMLIKAWSKTYGLPYYIIRPSNNYGSLQYPEKLIPATIKNYICDRKLQLHDSGTPIRTWLNVVDTCKAIYTVIEKSKSTNEIFNISSPDVYTNLYVVSKIFEILQKYLKKDITIEQFLDYNYKRPGQDVRYNVDDSKLKGLGWKNENLFEDKIEKIVVQYVEFHKTFGVIF